MSRVYWDSMMFIYMLEGNPTFGPLVLGILDDMDRRGDTLCTSSFCIGEVLTGPRKFNPMAGIAKVKWFRWDMTKLGLLNWNIAHDNEMYGIIGAFLRIKGLVPPSSEGRP